MMGKRGRGGRAVTSESSRAICPRHTDELAWPLPRWHLKSQVCKFEGITLHQGPTLGAHAHQRPCPWVLGGHGCNISGHGWAWVPYYNGWAWVCER